MTINHQGRGNSRKPTYTAIKKPEHRKRFETFRIFQNGEHVRDIHAHDLFTALQKAGESLKCDPRKLDGYCPKRAQPGDEEMVRQNSILRHGSVKEKRHG